MRIAFRTDASLKIGTGHVMRCLTLADALRERGARCTFICRQHSAHLLEMIVQRGHRAVALPSLATTTNYLPDDTAHAAWLGADWLTDAQQTRDALCNQSIDWLVVDHYALDHRWEQALRPYCQNLMAIDDLADRPHVCNLLLDQTFGRDATDYRSLVPADCNLLCGSQYALLRPEFAALRRYSLQRRAQPALRELLITMGGVDKTNATGQVLQALRACRLPEGCRVTVVMGATAPWLEEVRTQAQDMSWPTRVLVGVSDMADLMAASDLAIGAAGATSWERCCLGLPTIMFVLAKNQLKIAQGLERAGAAILISPMQSVTAKLPKQLLSLVGDAQILQSMSDCAARIVDGSGLNSILREMEVIGG
jgi:UDP-2,4-diacetamido-2,4,6-trideoxy-beta-L-altropyranose hydrolase